VKTLFATILRRHPRLKYNRQLVRMDYGGVVALDFEPLEMDEVIPLMHFTGLPIFGR